jgi:hypothetical protein
VDCLYPDKALLLATGMQLLLLASLVLSLVLLPDSWYMLLLLLLQVVFMVQLVTNPFAVVTLNDLKVNLISQVRKQGHMIFMPSQSSEVQRLISGI